MAFESGDDSKGIVGMQDHKEDRLEFFDGEPESLAAIWYEWRQQEQARRFNPFAKSSAAELSERIRVGSRELKDADLEQPPSSILRFVRLRADGAIVGQVNLHAINSKMQNAEIGYQIDEAHYGKGYATEMVGSWIEQVFKETGIRKLLAFVAEENVASCRVVEKLGFKREGLLREHYLIEGKPVNEVLYGLLKREWSWKA